MPKIISANKESIIKVTNDIIKNEDYENLNCRYIANKAGIGLGTIYHFFKSKDEILAFILLDDWKSHLKSINLNCKLLEGVENIYNGLMAFSKKYYSLWEYTKKFSNEYISYLSKHSILVNQISALLIELYKFNKVDFENDEIEFIAEMILIYATRLYDYNRMEKIFIKIIGGK